VFYSLLIIAGIIVLIWGKKRFAELPPEQRKSALTNWVLIGAAALIVGLVLAGRAPWLMGVLAALMAVAGRVVQLASYMPMFKKLFGQEGPAQSGGQKSQSNTSQAPSVSMDKQQAAEILGVAKDADVEEIKLAHKRLMQKLHPDRGGSDALAKQINKAKDVLLS